MFLLCYEKKPLVEVFQLVLPAVFLALLVLYEVSLDLDVTELSSLCLILKFLEDFSHQVFIKESFKYFGYIGIFAIRF